MEGTLDLKGTTPFLDCTPISAMKSFLFATFTLCLGAATLQADTKVIEAFEGDGFDSWQATGTGFGLAPIAGKVDGVNGEFRNYGGNALVCSGLRGDAATGTLTSPEMKLTHASLGFLVAGGNHPGKTAVQLLIGGKVVRETTGANDLTLRETVWDIAEFKGKSGVIRIIDTHVGAWGFIAADHFVFSSEAKPAFPKGGRPKPKADSSLVRVVGEGSAALVPAPPLRSLPTARSPASPRLPPSALLTTAPFTSPNPIASASASKTTAIISSGTTTTSPPRPPPTAWRCTRSGRPRSLLNG